MKAFQKAESAHDALLSGGVDGARPRPRPAKRGRLTVEIDLALIERAKDAAYQTPGLTMAALVAAGLESELVRLERGRKEAFKPRKERLTAGRPLKPLR